MNNGSPLLKKSMMAANTSGLSTGQLYSSVLVIVTKSLPKNTPAMIYEQTGDTSVVATRAALKVLAGTRRHHRDQLSMLLECHRNVLVQAGQAGRDATKHIAQGARQQLQQVILALPQMLLPLSIHSPLGSLHARLISC